MKACPCQCLRKKWCMRKFLPDAMPRIPGISQRNAIKALQKAGFIVARQSKHIIMQKGAVAIQIPRHAQINPLTMGGIAKDAGLTPEQFRQLL